MFRDKSPGNTKESKEITREVFVRIASEAIKQIRTDITVSNQISGYYKFHRELKQNKYFRKFRKYTAREEHKPEEMDSLVHSYALIKHARLGNCHELAEYLCMELIKRLQVMGAKASISIVASKKVDHIFVRVRIKLKGEENYSTWEIDAWDPRIGDISLRSDGSRKNKSLMIYGEKIRVIEKFNAETFLYEEPDFKITLEKPKEGLGDCPTPEHQFFTKHKKKYRDYTVDEAVKKRKIPADDKHLGYLQKVSKWQKSNTP